MYCLFSDIVNKTTAETLEQLISDSGASANIDLIEYFIGNASNVIDTFIKNRYILPLTLEHSILKNICIEFIKYELYARRGLITDINKAVYDSSIKQLDDIKNGVIKLTGETRTNTIVVNSREPIYNISNITRT